MVSDVFQKMRSEIHQWSGLESIEGSIDTLSQSRRGPEMDSPQAHWGLHHLAHNANDATTSSHFSPDLVQMSCYNS